MDNETKALNEEVEENNLDATPATEEIAEEVTEPEVETESTEEVETEDKETESEEERKGYSKRVRELNAKAKAEAEGRIQAEAKVQSLAEKIAELTRQDEPKAGYQPTQYQQDQPIVAPGEEIDALELDKRLRNREQQQIQRTDALIQLRGKQQEAINRVVIESSDAVKKYPELDPDSDSFNNDLSESVTEAVEAHIRANPYNASVKNFVEKLMKPYKKAVAKEAGKVSEDLAKQSSQASLKPSSVRKGEKTAEDMSIEELEKKLGTVQG